MGDYDKIINEEEEYEAEDADDIKEQENPKEFDDAQGENTAAREMEEKEGEEEGVEGRVALTYSKKKKSDVKKIKKTNKAKHAAAKKKIKKKGKKKAKKKPAKRGKRKR